jgi:hypothetical protein
VITNGRWGSPWGGAFDLTWDDPDVEDSIGSKMSEHHFYSSKRAAEGDESDANSPTLNALFGRLGVARKVFLGSHWFLGAVFGGVPDLLRFWYGVTIKNMFNRPLPVESSFSDRAYYQGFYSVRLALYLWRSSVGSRRDEWRKAVKAGIYEGLTGKPQDDSANGAEEKALDSKIIRTLVAFQRVQAFFNRNLLELRRTAHSEFNWHYRDDKYDRGDNDNQAHAHRFPDRRSRV